MIGINLIGVVRKFQDGGISEIVTGMVPIYGTYLDAKKFINEPTWNNFGWVLASGIGDIFFFTGAGAGIKALKAARAANAARKALTLKRSQKLLEAKNTYYNTKLARSAGESTKQEMKTALQRLLTVYNNYLVSLNKLKASEKLLLGEAEKLGKSSLLNITKDGIIQTVLMIDNEYY